MPAKIDHELRDKFHEIDKEYDKFRKAMCKKYDVFLAYTGSIEYNSLTILMTDEDAKKALSPTKYKKWLEFRP